MSKSLKHIAAVGAGAIVAMTAATPKTAQANCSNDCEPVKPPVVKPPVVKPPVVKPPVVQPPVQPPAQPPVNNFNPTVRGGDSRSVSGSHSESDANAYNALTINNKPAAYAPAVITNANGLCASGFGLSFGQVSATGGISWSSQNEKCLSGYAAQFIMSQGVKLGDPFIIAAGLASLAELYDDIKTGNQIVISNALLPCAPEAAKFSPLLLAAPLDCKAFGEAVASRGLNLAAAVQEGLVVVFNGNNTVSVSIDEKLQEAVKVERAKSAGSSNKTTTRRIEPRIQTESKGDVQIKTPTGEVRLVCSEQIVQTTNVQRVCRPDVQGPR